MKKFKFKLDIILQERKRVEDLRLREWTLAQQILQTMFDELARLEKGLKEGIVKASDLADSDPAAADQEPRQTVGMFVAIDRFIEGQKIRIIWKSREIERGTKLTERKRLEYVHARQRREALEKLKERRLSEHNAMMRKAELKAQDELYIMSGAARRVVDEPEESTG